MTPSPAQPMMPITNDNLEEWYQFVFAPWVKSMGLCDFDATVGHAAARLPNSPAIQFSSGAVCGQAIMAAVDTIASLAVSTTERTTKGTTYQHTHFLRPARDDDFRIEANVLRFGKASAFVETRVTLATSGELVAHATLEFAF